MSPEGQFLMSPDTLPASGKTLRAEFLTGG